MSDRPDDDVTALTTAADRLDELADAAELMGDDATMQRLRHRAAGHRADALDRLDERDGR